MLISTCRLFAARAIKINASRHIPEIPRMHPLFRRWKTRPNSPFISPFDLLPDRLPDRLPDFGDPTADTAP